MTTTPQDDQGDELLEELVVRFLDRRESEGPSALEAMCGEHPELAAALRVRISSLRDAGLLDDEGGEQREFPERLGDFRLLERLGGGAMGVVYRAQQESLGREVALKLIRPEQLYFPGARERFRREIEAVARLQHPGVVPIYTVGEERGIPFFAMERVRGCTLGDVVEALAKREPASLTGADFDRVIAERTGDEEQRPLAPIFAGSWIETSVRIAREVAEALEHVHRRGVLHRDVKPSNVMVTREGRVMLVDFGLASAQGVDRLTRTGSQLGSLAYMSPEQVRGAPGNLDARSDVYSLGIVLYELLALELPFDGDSVVTVRRLIEVGRPQSLRTRNPDVDWDVETVCFTAIERDPERRYATAADLAHDLSNLLEHRPIAARRASFALRARRWAQRHPAASVAIVLGAALVVVAPSIYAWQEHVRVREIGRKNAEIENKNAELQRAFDKERDLRAESDAQRARAERNFGAAFEAVRTMLENVGARELANVPEMEEARHKLLERALAFYQGFLRDAGDKSLLRIELAQTQRYVGDVLSDLNRIEDAIAAYRESIATYRRLCGERPDDLKATIGLSNALVPLARNLADAGQFDESAKLADEAVGLARAAYAGKSDDVVLHSGFAGALRARAMIAKQAGRTADAVRDLEEMLRTCRDVEERSSDDPELLDVEAKALITLGTLEYSDGRVLQARDQFRRAVVIRQAAFEREPRDRWARVELAEALTDLGMACWSLPDPSEAEGAYRRALEIDDSLIRDFPRTAFYRQGLISIAMNLGILLEQRRNDLEGAERLVARAVELGESLVAERPDAAEYQHGLGTALASLAGIQRSRGRLDDAAANAERALVVERAALATAPDNVDYLVHMRQNAFIAVDVHLTRGAHAEAAKFAREAVGHARGDWTTLAIAGTRFAKCVELAENDGELDDARRADLVDEYTRESLDALQAAVETGHAQWDELAGSHYLDAVRSNERFERITELARRKVD